MNEKDFSNIQQEAFLLAKKKNADYSGASFDNLSITGVNGIAVRLIDKIARVYNLTEGSKPQVNESLRDTMIDIANYAVIGTMMIDGTWGERDDYCNIKPLAVGSPSDDLQTSIKSDNFFLSKKICREQENGSVAAIEKITQRMQEDDGEI